MIYLDQYQGLEESRNILLWQKVAGPGFTYESTNKGLISKPDPPALVLVLVQG
jgi:hypothetical protein